VTNRRWELVRLYSNPGASFETLLHVRVRAKSSPRNQGRPVSRRTQIRLGSRQAKALAAAYRDGKTIKELSQRFGIHRTTVTTVLGRHGVETRRAGLLPAEVPAAATMYDQGWSLAWWAQGTALTPPRSGGHFVRRAWRCVRQVRAGRIASCWLPMNPSLDSLCGRCSHTLRYNLSRYETLSLLVSALSLLIAALGFFALAVSIRILAKQTRQVAIQSENSVRALKASTFGDSGESMFAIDAIFVEYPDCRPYFYEAKKLATDDNEASRVLAIAEMLLDFFDYILLHQKSFSPIYPGHQWREYMVDTFAASEVLCDVLNNNANWYTEALVVIARQGCSRRRRAVPTANSDLVSAKQSQASVLEPKA
jgi:hypothetical protein